MTLDQFLDCHDVAEAYEVVRTYDLVIGSDEARIQIARVLRGRANSNYVARVYVIKDNVWTSLDVDAGGQTEGEALTSAGALMLPRLPSRSQPSQ
jgi:hypothetical protein